MARQFDRQDAHANGQWTSASCTGAIGACDRCSMLLSIGCMPFLLMLIAFADLTGGYQNLDDLTTRLHASFHGQQSSPGARQASTADTQPASRARDRTEHSSLLAEPGATTL